MRTLSTVALAALALAGLGCGGVASSQDAPDAVVADPQHYTVEFENDVIRVIRIKYAAGETSTMHRHAANCAVFLTAFNGTFKLPNDSTVSAEGPAGQVQCGDAEVHLPSPGAAAFEGVLIELKGREKFAP